MASGFDPPEQFRGWLMKWTNYIRGYQKRWFVLSNGLLSYYRTQEEMAHTCRGSLNLAGAYIDVIDACNFVVTNGPYQVFHLRTQNEVERQRWVTALELARQKAIQNDSEESDDESIAEEGDSSKKLKDKLKELQVSQESLLKNCNSLLKSLSELDSHHKVVTNSKEKLTAVKHLANSYVKLAGEFYHQADHTQKIWAKALKREKNRSERILENMEVMVQDMPLMMHKNESKEKQKETPTKEKPGSSEPPTPGKAVRYEGTDGPPKLDKRHSMVVMASSSYPDDDEDDFEDAHSEFTSSPPPTKPEGKIHHQRSISEGSILVSPKKPDPEPKPPTARVEISTPVGPAPSFFVDVKPTLAKRRTTIPDRPQSRLNLWAIMKNCIGRDLSKIPMPVNFNEPISFTQRVMEDVAYCDILSRAAVLSDSAERLAYVGAFSVSSYASTSYRVNKPFNPLLGETFELDRRAEKGWRGFCEQVSHHPPACAMYVEHERWTYWQEFTMTSKFRGAYLNIIPYGIAHLKLHNSGDHYTWSRPNMTVYNIIVGRLYVDNVGEAEITNHVTGDRLNMKWHGYTYFSRERQRKVTGTVFDKTGTPKYVLTGYWDEYMECAKVIGSSGKNLKTEPPTVVWKMDPLEPGIEKRYSLGSFQCSLNEMEEGIACTDSRLRPDVRLTEQGDFDRANEEKLRLEEKQRAKRRVRESAAQRAAEAAARGDKELAEKLEKEATYTPVWFQKQYDHHANAMFHQYKGGYWEAKQNGQFPELPDLY